MALDQTISLQKFSGSGTGAASFGIAPAPGATVVVFITTWQGSTHTVSVTDNKGNTYTVLGGARDPSSGGQGWLAYCHNVTTGGTFTITVTPGDGGMWCSWSAISWTGLVNRAPDQTAQAATAGTTISHSATTAAVSQPHEFVVASFNVDNADSNLNIVNTGSGYTQQHLEHDSLNFVAGWAGYKDVTGGGAQSASLSFDLAFSSGVVATFYYPNSNTYTPSGGVSLAGSAPIARTIVPPVSGGIVLAGDAPYSRVFAALASGGITLAGDALYSRVFAALTSGGITFTGDALASFHPGGGGASEFIYAGSGGVSFGGAALVEFLRNLPPPPRGRWLGRRATERLLLRQRRSWDGPPTPR